MQRIRTREAEEFHFCRWLASWCSAASLNARSCSGVNGAVGGLHSSRSDEFRSTMKPVLHDARTRSN